MESGQAAIALAPLLAFTGASISGNTAFSGGGDRTDGAGLGFGCNPIDSAPHAQLIVEVTALDPTIALRARGTEKGYPVAAFDTPSGTVYVTDFRQQGSDVVDSRAEWFSNGVAIRFSWASAPLDPEQVGKLLGAAIPDVLAVVGAMPDDPR